MKLLFVSQHFYPEAFRINDICFSLAKRGHDVTVLTGLPNYPEGKIYPGYEHGKNRDQIINGVHIIRCSLIGRGKNILQFGLNYLWFAISGSLKAKKIKEQFDLVFSYQTSPVTMAWPAIQVKKMQGIPLIIHCLDQWPISITAGPFHKGSLPYKFFYKLSVNTYNKADLITITSKSFEQYFNEELKISSEQYGLKYWPQYAEDEYAQTTTNRDGVFDLLYAGNIGPAADVETIMYAAVKLKDNKKIHFHIVGDGMNRQNCETICRENNLSNVTFYGSHPVSEMNEYYSKADAFLITMKDNPVVNYTLPAKMQSYMLAGKPIIGAINGETMRVITESDCGLCVKSGDYGGLAEIIAKLAMDEDDLAGKGENARNYYEEHFNKEILLDQLEQYMFELIEKTKGNANEHLGNRC